MGRSISRSLSRSRSSSPSCRRRRSPSPLNHRYSRRTHRERSHRSSRYSHRHRRRSRSSSSCRCECRSPSYNRHRTRSPTPRRHGRRTPRSSLSPLSESGSSRVNSTMCKKDTKKQKKEEEEKKRLQHEAKLKLLEEETAKRLEETIWKNVEEKMSFKEVRFEIGRRIEEGSKKLFEDVSAQLKKEREAALMEEETAKRLKEAISKNVDERMNTEEVKLDIERRIEGGCKRLFEDISVQLENEKKAALMETRRKEENMSRTKHMAKRGRSISNEGVRIRDNPPEAQAGRWMLHFTEPDHQKRFAKLKEKPFAQSHYIDWNILAGFGIEGVMRQLVSFGGWDRLLTIHEPVYKELTLEFLTTFSLENNDISHEANNSMSFSINGQLYQLSLSSFSVLMGLYDENYVKTNDYKDLPLKLPRGVSESVYWRHISGATHYVPSESRASALLNPAPRVVHWVLARSLAGRGKSHGVVSLTDMIYLHSINEHRPINLGVRLAFFLLHQAKHPSVKYVCAGPYITRLVKRLGIFDGLPAMEQVNETLPMSSDSLKVLGAHRIAAAQGGAEAAAMEEEIPLNPPASEPFTSSHRMAKELRRDVKQTKAGVELLLQAQNLQMPPPPPDSDTVEDEDDGDESVAEEDAGGSMDEDESEECC